MPTPSKAGVVALADVLRADLAEIGVSLRPHPVDVGELKRRAAGGRFEMLAWWHQGGLLTLDAYRDPGQGLLGWGDWGRCRDGAMAAAMLGADSATNDEERTAFALAFHRAASASYPMLFVYRQLPRTFIHRRFAPLPPDRAMYGGLHLLRVPRERRLPRDDLGVWLP